MILRGYRINSQMHLEAVAIDVANLPELMKSGPLWLDIEAARPEELKEILAPLKLDPLAVDGCLAPGHRTRAELYDDCVFLEFPVGSETLDVHFLRIICLHNLLVVIHDQAAPEAESKLRPASSTRVRVPGRNSAALLCVLLDLTKAQDVRAALMLRDEVRQLADKLDDKPESVEGGDIQFLKRRESVIASRLQDQLACLYVLEDVEAYGVGSLKGRFDNFRMGLQSLTRMMDRLESQLQDVRQQFMAVLQGKTNRRLNVLTIVQAVFVPVSLIAVIYGIGFENMPARTWPNGLFFLLALMASLAVGELLYFYRRGWFD